MPPSKLLIVWSIRLAMAAFALVLIGRVAAVRSERWAGIARWLWAAGLVLATLHVLSAFHFVHGWSHAAALADTARQTREQSGWAVGAGVYFNYAFIAVWGADAAWWWLRPDRYARRSTGWSVVIGGYLLFIALSATVVFESGPIRWFGLAAAGIALLLVILRIRRKLPETKRTA